MKQKINKKINSLLSSVKRKGMQDFITWLNESSDFFTAPCSIIHHLNEEGGLAKHSWNVYQLFKEKNERYKLGLNKDSIIICGLFHDICKVNFFKEVIKKSISGNNDYHGYNYNDTFPVGHGEKSVIRLLRYMFLTDEECCIIRWHMAVFDLSQYAQKTYYNAIKMYPACLALHTADYEATTFLEK